MRFKSIKTKILLSVLLIIFVAGAMATYAVFTYSKNMLIDNEKISLDRLNAGLSGEISQIFEDAQVLAKTVAEQKFVKDLLILDDKNTENSIEQELSMYNIGNMFSAIYVMNTEGLTLSSTDDNFVGNNYKFRNYFQEARNGNLAVDVVLGVTTNRLGYYFSAPVKNGDDVIGVLVLKMKPEFIHGDISSNGRGMHSKIMMTDMFGVVVYSSDDTRIYKSLGELSLSDKQRITESRRFANWDIEAMKYNPVQAAINKGDDSILIEFYDEMDRERELLSARNIVGYPFYLVIEEEADIYYQDASRIAYILSIFVFIAAMLAGIVISFIIFKFLRPLISLKESVNRISEGDYGTKLSVKKNSSEELVDLTNAFNKMIAGIKKSRKEVDLKVREQTSELREKSEEMEKQQKAILNILEDVEDEKDIVLQEKDKINRILESIGDAVFVVNSSNNIILANQAALDLSGYKLKDVVGKKYAKILNLTSTDKNEKRNIIAEALKKGGVITESQHTVFIDKDKAEIPVAITASSLRKSDNAKKSRGCVVVLRDVHKEREVDKAKTEFVSLASHQLRTPLSAINWYTEMLIAEDAGKINKEQRQYLDEIYKGNQRMVSLVNSLLNVSRLELGTFMIEAQLTNIVEIAESVIKELEVTIKEKKQKVSLVADKKIPEIKVDPNLMRIIFQNLLSNAVKYTPEKGRVNVKIEVLAEDMLIQVDDSGMGIPKKQQKEIFKKLFRADNVRETDTEGTGLGLYIIKSILDTTGGKIWFASQEGKGTIFNITIPLTGMKSKKGTKTLT